MAALWFSFMLLTAYIRCASINAFVILIVSSTPSIVNPSYSA